ncbi:hypothetical protein ACQJBY_032672 [Aegilops geniculata]
MHERKVSLHDDKELDVNINKSKLMRHMIISHKALWCLSNQVATDHHDGSPRCPPATLYTTPVARWAGSFWRAGTQEQHTPYNLKDTFIRLDMTLTDAALPPLLLETSQRVSLLPLCFNGCFNALRLSVMSS